MKLQRLMTVSALCALAGCASVKIMKVTNGQPTEGVPFYLPRPYVQVYEPFVVSSQAVVVRQARDLVVHHAAVDRPHAGQDAFVERTRQRWQLAVHPVQTGLPGFAQALQKAHAVMGRLPGQAVDEDEDDFVFHR